mgnify:CR=1 FL=1
MNDLILLIIALSLAAIVGAGVVFYLLSSLKRARAGKDIDKISLKIITERVRAVTPKKSPPQPLDSPGCPPSCSHKPRSR